MGTRGRVKGAAAVRRWFAIAEAVLEDHRGQLNRLNVFPVADADTGSNMLAAVRVCRQAAEETDTEDLGELVAAAGAEAMNQARGNSGTLLAVLVSGVAERLHGAQRLTVSNLSEGLDRASLRAWSALSSPVDGTMLSVLDAMRHRLREEAAAAEEPESRAALEVALPPMLAGGREALERTEHQLGALTQARVVDAGGIGLLLVLAALVAAVRDEDPATDLLDGLAGWQSGEVPEEPAAPSSSAEVDSELEIMSTVRMSPLGAASLRHRLDELGEAVIITPITVPLEDDQAGHRVEHDDAAEDDYRWRIHVHVTPQARQQAAEAIAAAGEVEASSERPLSVAAEGSPVEPKR